MSLAGYLALALKCPKYQNATQERRKASVDCGFPFFLQSQCHDLMSSSGVKPFAFFASFWETTTRSIVAVESRCREGSPLPAICQHKHFSRCSISHICYQLQMFFGCMETSHPRPFLRSAGHPPFSIQMCCTISEMQSGKESQLVVSFFLPVMD